MGRSSNIFLLGRRRDDEVQLTHFLGALLQREPDSLRALLGVCGVPIDTVEDLEIECERVVSQGRFDVVVHDPGKVLVVFEAKLGASLGSSQVLDYLTHLDGAGDALKALVLVGPRRLPISPAEQAFADTHSVLLRSITWAEVAAAFEDSGEDCLPADFREMLMEEGLAAFPRVDAADLQAWNHGARTAGLLRLLLEQVANGIATARPDTVTVKSTKEDSRSIRVELEWAQARMVLRATANKSPRNPTSEPLLIVQCRRRGLDGPSGRQWAEHTCGSLPNLGLRVVPGGYVQHNVPADHILAKDDPVNEFRELAEQVLNALQAADLLQIPPVEHPPAALDS